MKLCLLTSGRRGVAWGATLLFAALLWAAGGLFSLAVPSAWAKDMDQIVLPAPPSSPTPPPLPRFKRRDETHLRYGPDGRSVMVAEHWEPFYQEQDRVLYGDFRTSGDNQDNFEGNLGVGYRQIYQDAVVGGYAFADHRLTALGGKVWQATLGAEYIRPDWEMRVNAYWPLSPALRLTGESGGAPYLAGTGVYVPGPLELIEEPQKGIDAEVGFRLPVAEDYIGTLRVYGGGYVFRGDETPGLTGVRARLSADLAPWLRVGARAQYDDQREEQVSVELTLRWPGVTIARGPYALSARLGDSPERDVDVVTATSLTEGPPEPVLDAETGQAVHILYVDGAASLDGTGAVETPFADLPTAVAAAKDHDMIYVVARDDHPVVMPETLALTKQGLTVLGSGSPLYFDGSRFVAQNGIDYTFAPLLPAGAYPIITSATGAGVTIAADGISLMGLQIDGGAGDGVVIADGVTGTVLNNMQITGNAGAGLVVQQSGLSAQSLIVRDTVIAGNLGAGVSVQALSGAGDLALDFGRADDYGFNDIFGNIGGAFNLESHGQPVSAQGNFWGGAAPQDVTGPEPARLDVGVYAITPFCTECVVSGLVGQRWDAVPAGDLVESNPVIVSGFTGHRYVQILGDEEATWSVNGVAVESNVARVAGGDQVAVRMVSPSFALNVTQAQVNDGVNTHDYLVQTSLLPNAIPNLLGWWDGANLDRANVSGGVWQDKGAYGLDAVGAGDGTFHVGTRSVLSSLSDGMTLIARVDGSIVPTTSTLFSYGVCTGLATSRCLALVDAGDDLYGLRGDTQAARNQTPATLTGSTGADWILSAVLSSDGMLSLYRDGVLGGQGSLMGASGVVNGAGLFLWSPDQSGLDEILLFGPGLDENARQLVESYLMTPD